MSNPSDTTHCPGSFREALNRARGVYLRLLPAGYTGPDHMSTHVRVSKAALRNSSIQYMIGRTPHAVQATGSPGDVVGVKADGTTIWHYVSDVHGAHCLYILT